MAGLFYSNYSPGSEYQFPISGSPFFVVVDPGDIKTGSLNEDTGSLLVDWDSTLIIDSSSVNIDTGWGGSGSLITVFPITLNSTPLINAVLIGSLNGTPFDVKPVTPTSPLSLITLTYIGDRAINTFDIVTIQISSMPIVQQPSGKIASANNDNYYSVFSANQYSSSYKDYKYIADVYSYSGSIAVSGSGTFITRLKTFPDPTFNYGTVNMLSIAPYLIGSDFIAVENSASLYSTASNSSVNLQLSFGEEFFDTSDVLFTQNLNLTTSSLIPYINSSIGYKEYQTINLNDYYLDGSGSKVLTPRKLNNTTNPWKAYNSLKQWLYFYNVSSGSGNATITTYSDTNFSTQLGKYTIQNSYSGSSGVQILSVGVPQLSGLLTSGFTVVSGSSSIITSNVQTYSVKLSNNPTTYYYQILQDCGRFAAYSYKLYWMNEFAGYSSWLFNKLNLTTTSKTQSTFKKIPGQVGNLGWSTKTYSAGVQPFFTELTDTINVSTDFLTDEEVGFLKSLYSSPIVYLEDSAGDVIRVTIQTNSYTLNKKVNQKIYSLQLALNPSINDFRQVL